MLSVQSALGKKVTGESSGDGSGGGGGVMGVASVSWVVGWALVPVLAPPPPLHPRIPVAPGAYWTLGWRGGGGGGEDQGVVGPPSTPLPLARPEKIVPWEGVSRGG